MRRFLLLHGWEGSGLDHWQTWLAEHLRSRGQDVSYPTLPDPYEPKLSPWLGALDEELDAADGRELTVVAHSLACILWMHHAARRNPRRAERVLLVAPPDYQQPLASFFPAPLDAGAVSAAADQTLLVCSDNDPYCPGGAASLYAKPLQIPHLVMPGDGHINTDVGYGSWPWVLDWSCSGEV